MIRISVSGDDISKLIDQVVQKTSLDLHGQLVLSTPVDTGNARAGWTVDAKAGLIENNVEYVAALNNGTSKQAPAGFIEAAIDKVTR